jgi:PAS domain S-box-containing protein
LFERIDAGFCIIRVIFDETGRGVDHEFLEMNAAFEQHTGIRNASGKRARELVPGLEPRWPEMYGVIVRSGKPARFEDESPAMGRWFDVYAFPLGQRSEGKLALLFTDVTVRKQTEQRLRENEEQLRALYEQNPAMVTLSNLSDGRILQVNRAFTEMLGFSPEEALGRSPVELGIFAYARERERLVAAIRGTGSVRGIEIRLRAKDGQEVIGLLSATIVHAGGQDRLITTVSDITERKRTETALATANERLLKVDRRKNEFSAVLSHELRNALAPIRNSVFVLQRAAPESAQAQRAHGAIQRQLRQLTRLVEDLLDVTRIAQGKIQLKRGAVEINALVQATFEDYREDFERNGVTLTVLHSERELWVNGDPDRLMQVLGNLLTNALKFTRRGSAVVVSVAPGEEGGAVICVRDDGLGMSAATLERLFEPFEQAEATLGNQSRTGLGLGLALVRGLVAMHGGTVTAASKGEGHGSEFKVTLPTRAPASPDLPEEAAPVSQYGAAALRIVIIDDHVDAAESLKEVLDTIGHTVITAYSGLGGLAVTKQVKPDVVVCDIGLPDTDGLTVARTLREDPDPEVSSCFLVALSGYASAEDARLAVDSGFDRHIAKPPDLEQLARTLAEARRKRRASPILE